MRIQETRLTEAVIKNDIDTVHELKDSPDEVLRVNSVGFNAAELALYLNRKEIFKILKPFTKTFYVIPKDQEEVKKISVNEFEELFGVNYLANLKFESYEQFLKVLRVCPKNLKESERTYINAEVQIRWIDPVLGYGLFAAKDLRRGDYVIEYVGLVHQVPLFNPDLNAYSLRYPKKFWSFSYFVIDAFMHGNESRFINHSFKPNLELKAVVDRNLVHLHFCAVKNISKGAQLTWDYGEDFWRYREPPIEIYQFL